MASKTAPTPTSHVCVMVVTERESDGWPVAASITCLTCADAFASMYEGM